MPPLVLMRYHLNVPFWANNTSKMSFQCSFLLACQTSVSSPLFGTSGWYKGERTSRGTLLTTTCTCTLNIVHYTAPLLRICSYSLCSGPDTASVHRWAMRYLHPCLIGLAAASGFDICFFEFSTYNFLLFFYFNFLSKQIVNTNALAERGFGFEWNCNFVMRNFWSLLLGWIWDLYYIFL